MSAQLPAASRADDQDEPRHLQPRDKRCAPTPVPTGPARWWRLLPLPVGLLLLILANRSLNRQELPPVVALSLVAGLVAVGYDAWLARGGVRPRPAEPAEPHPTTSVRVPILGISVAAAIFAYAWSDGNTFRTIGVACWLLSIVAWIAAWWPGRPDWTAIRRARLALSNRDILVAAILVLVVAMGAFYRLHRIDETPLNPTSDHAEKLLDVTDVLNGSHPVYFERNTGREPAQFYLTAGMIRAFDLPTNFTTLKIGTGLVGALTIPFVYLLAAELAGRSAGLLAAALFAIGTWPVEISRAGLRFPFAVIGSAATLWLLLRWMRTRDRRDALLCGLSTGIGLYGYSPFRLVVLAVIVGLALTLIASRGASAMQRVVGDGLLLGGTAAIVFVPLGRYALEHWEMFWSRASGRLTADDPGKSALGELIHQLPTFVENNWNAVLGFNWRGDSTWVNGVHFAPMLDLITGALFLAGLVTILAAVVLRRDARAGFVVAAIPILLLSSTLAVAFPLENPNVAREGPLAPIVFTIAALPLAMLSTRLRNGLGSWRAYFVAVPAITSLIATAALLSFDQYFHDFDRQARAAVPNTIEIATAIRGAAVVGVSPADAYIIDMPHWLDARNIGIALDDIGWWPAHSVRVGEPLPAQPADRSMLFILNHNDTERLDEVTRAFPSGHVTVYPAELPSQAFVVVWVPAPGPDRP